MTGVVISANNKGNRTTLCLSLSRTPTEFGLDPSLDSQECAGPYSGLEYMCNTVDSARRVIRYCAWCTPWMLMPPCRDGFYGKWLNCDAAAMLPQLLGSTERLSRVTDFEVCGRPGICTTLCYVVFTDGKNKIGDALRIQNTTLMPDACSLTRFF